MYHVSWSREAEVELVTIEIEMDTDSELVDAVTNAMETIDLELTTIPLGSGHARSSSVHRYVFRDPLAVEFEVIEDDKRVIIHSVSLFWQSPADDRTS